MLLHNIETAFRHMRQHVGTTLINVACLTFGLIVFLLAWGRAEYFSNADRYHERGARTVLLTRFQPQSRMTIHITAGALAEHLRSDFPELELVARVMYPQEVAVAAGERSQFGLVAYADADFLQIFDLPFAAGDARAALNQPNSIVISESLAQRLFGTVDVLGRTIRLDGRSQDATITGVVRSIPSPSHLTVDEPAAFGLKLGFDALVSMDMNPSIASIADWEQDSYFTYAVLPRAGLDAVNAFDRDLASFTQRRVPPELLQRMAYGARPVSDFTQIGLDTVARTDITGISSAAILKALGVLVLLIASLNYMNLATAIAMTHAKEVALRKVVGASRWQLATQHLIEGAVLTVIAAVTALLVLCVVLSISGIETLRTCVALLATSPQFWATLVIAVLGVSVGASTYPALILSRVRPASSLRSKSLHGGPRGLSTLLVAFQFAAASFLMSAVFVMASQHAATRRAISHPDSDPLLTIANSVRAIGIDPSLLKSELSRPRGVIAVTGMDRMPWSLGSETDTLALTADAAATGIQASRLVVDFNFFETLDIALIAGRTFDRTRAADVADVDAWTKQDASASSEFNAIVDEKYVERLGLKSAAQAIGREVYRATSVDGSKPPQRVRIIGVVARNSVLPMNLGMPVFYMLNPQAASIPIVRISRQSDVTDTIERIDAVWKSLAPDIPLRRRFADEQYDLSFGALSGLNKALAMLSIIAAAVAVMGLIGMAFHVTRRRMHEIGVRKTLGARGIQIYTMLLRSFSVPVVIANLAVWPLVYVVMNAYLSVFATRNSLTPFPFLVTLIGSLVVACLAVSVQSLRAARMKPADVLRYE
jgi:putative ABC transport system permease protein